MVPDGRRPAFEPMIQLPVEATREARLTGLLSSLGGEEVQDRGVHRLDLLPVG